MKFLLFFFFLLKKHKLWVYVKTASLGRFPIYNHICESISKIYLHVKGNESDSLLNQTLPSVPFDVTRTRRQRFLHVLKTSPSPKKRYKSETSSTFTNTFGKLKKHVEWARPDDVLIRIKNVLSNLKSKRLHFVFLTYGKL